MFEFSNFIGPIISILEVEEAMPFHTKAHGEMFLLLALSAYERSMLEFSRQITSRGYHVEKKKRPNRIFDFTSSCAQSDEEKQIDALCFKPLHEIQGWFPPYGLAGSLFPPPGRIFFTNYTREKRTCY